MRRRPGFTIIELLVIIAVIAIMAGILVPTLARARSEANKAKCRSNLGQLAKAMNMYLVKYGRNSTYALPAKAFRGDVWLAELYWCGLLDAPQVLRCPGTNDGTPLPATRTAAGDLTGVDAVADHAVSYAGLCRGLTAFPHRNTSAFAESAIGSSMSALACDDNAPPQNHRSGLNVVFFDGHCTFRSGEPAETYDRVGADGPDVLRYMDSGDD